MPWPWTEDEVAESYAGRKWCEEEEAGDSYVGSVTYDFHLEQVKDRGSRVQRDMARWLERGRSGRFSGKDLLDMHGHVLEYGDGPVCPCGWTYELQDGGRMECRRCGRARILQSGRPLKKANPNEAEVLEGSRWATFDPLREVKTLDPTKRTLLREALRVERKEAEHRRELGTLDQLL